MRRELSTTIVCAAVCLVPLAAHGQEAPSSPTAPAGQQNGDAEGIADIVVTAQRREETLQRAAIAVTAVSGDAIAEAGVTDVNNLTKLVPSLVVQPQGGASTNFYLRGVGSFGTNAFAENAVAFNFAGVYIARPTSPLGTLFDLQRIEVVKGPQGTLYGRNATGGAINVIPNAPDPQRVTADLTAEYGNYDTKKVAGSINIPLGQTAALRIAGQAVSRDAYLSDNYDDERGQALRASLLLRPSDSFSLTVIADYFGQQGRGVGSVLIPGATTPTAPALDERIAGSDPRSLAELSRRFPALINTGLVAGPRSDGFMRNTFYGITAIAEIDVDFATLTVLPAYRRSEPDFLSYTNGFLARVSEKDDQVSLELRLASNSDGPLRYVVGAYLFDERQDAENRFSQGPVSTAVYAPILNTNSKALFAQGTYALSPSFRLLAGGRYTREDKSLDTPLRLLSPATPNPSPVRVQGNLSFERFTWKAGFEFDAGPRSLIYANVATGFKAGGFFVSAVDNTTRPERLTAYTLGTKNRFLDNRLQLNVEAFYWDYRDQQVSFVGPAQYLPGVYSPGGITVNAGNARMYGADIDLLFQPTAADTFSVNVQYLDTKYNSFVYDTLSANGASPRNGCAISPSSSVPVNAPARLFRIDCSGRPALNAPKWAANIGYEHRFELTGDMRLTPGVRARLESERYLALEYLPEQRQKGYALVDLSLALENEAQGWSLTGFVNNLTDETVLSSAALRSFVPAVYGALRPPRTYGLRLGLRYR